MTLIISTLCVEWCYAECQALFYCYSACHYAECSYGECRYAECRGGIAVSKRMGQPRALLDLTLCWPNIASAQCQPAKCQSTKCQFAKCQSAKRFSTRIRGTIKAFVHHSKLFLFRWKPKEKEFFRGRYKNVFAKNFQKTLVFNLTNHSCPKVHAILEGLGTLILFYNPDKIFVKL
jgi:hypothetical protein